MQRNGLVPVPGRINGMPSRSITRSTLTNLIVDEIKQRYAQYERAIEEHKRDKQEITQKRNEEDKSKGENSQQSTKAP